MKKLVLNTLIIFSTLIVYTQNIYETTINRGSNGSITSVQFPDTCVVLGENIPINPKAFFQKYLGVSTMDQFVKNTKKSIKLEGKTEFFDQFYRNIKVDGAGYTFHFKKGKMFFAHGHYVKINNIDIEPTFSIETSIQKFAEYKQIPLDKITDSKVILAINEIPNGKGKDIQYTPILVYQIYLFADHLNNNEVGYVDAHNGEIVMTVPIVSNLSPTGTFATR